MTSETSWTGWLNGWQSFVSLWSEAMERALLGGTLALLLAFLLTRMFKRAQAGVRCWLWRLVFVKLTLLFFCGATLALSVLPEKPARDGGNFTAPTGTGALDTNPQSARMTKRDHTFGADWKTGQMALDSQGNIDFPDILMNMLPGLWSIGILVGLVRIGRQYRVASALVRSACPIADAALQTELIQAARDLGLQRIPALCVSDLTEVPLLFGWLSPVVILPSAVVTDFSSEERRMVLAHELAHIKRHDLAWMFLTGIAQVLFFFHPLVWIAHRELRLVQETCCDEQAIQSTAVSAHAYGKVLVRVAMKPCAAFQDGQITVAMVESSRSLPRRLEAMQTFRLRAGWRRWTPAMVAVIGGVALLPWQLEAQKKGRPQKSQSNPKPGNTPKQPVLGTIEADNYTLKIVDINHNQALNTNTPGRRVSPGKAGAARPVSPSYQPLELNITGKHPDDLMLLEGLEIHSGQDERGRTVSILGTTGKSIPLSPAWPHEDVLKGIFAPLMEQGAASLKTLGGALLVIKGTIQTVEFTDAEIRTGASKQVERISVTIEAVKETENGYEFSFTCKSPLLAPPRNAEEYGNQMLAGDRVLVAKLVGTDGSDYKLIGMGGSFQGSLYPQVYGDDAIAGGVPENYTHQQQLKFGPLRKGDRPKKLVFRVVERQGAIRRIPFKFTDIPLDGKQSGEPSGSKR